MLLRRLKLPILSRSCLPGRTVRPLSSRSDYLHFDHDVEIAIKNGDPVVALESTIVAHGMPFPQNLQTAQSVESIITSKVGF